jgi:NadR type nicotinamide-nucleotide adenylyltransferase
MEKTIDSKIIRVAIVGPESTGKSTLAELLAKHYHTVFVPEYAREYLDEIKRPYTLEDIVVISKKQMQLEDELAHKANNILICDTNLLVTKIWAEHKYGKCPAWIEAQYKQRHYNLYLLCNTDIPWQPDPQREHPHLREELFAIYKTELGKQPAPYSIITGLGDARLKNAVEAIEHFSPRFKPWAH